MPSLTETLEFGLARNGEIIRRLRGLKDRRRQSRILQATAKLNRLEYTIFEFLEIVSQEFETVQIPNEMENIEVNIIIIIIIIKEIPSVMSFGGFGIPTRFLR